MSTLVHPTVAPPTARVRRRRGDRPAPYVIAAITAFIGLVVGVGLAIDGYRDAQRHLDSFARVAVPGEGTVQLDEPTGRVLYYEGDDSVRFGDLDIRVTGPAGRAVDVNRYEGEMIYETIDLTKGRAVATFDAAQAGTYRIRVAGADGGTLTVGDSFLRRSLFGVFGGLAISVAAVLVAFLVVLVTFVRRRSST
jgi:hypothetical protein